LKLSARVDLGNESFFSAPQLKRVSLDSTRPFLACMDQLSRSEQVDTLRGFLSGEISSASLRERLSGHMSIEGDWASFDINITKPLEVHVTMAPQDLRPMLEKYLAWKVDDDELARWAALVLMLDAYTNPVGLTEAESDTLMDPVWDLLWDLSAPTVSGVNPRDRAARALPELSRLQGEIASRAV
jgi:hypothetical protein